MFYSKYGLNEIDVTVFLLLADFSTSDVSKHLSCDILPAWTVTFFHTYTICKITSLSAS